MKRCVIYHLFRYSLILGLFPLYSCDNTNDLIRDIQYGESMPIYDGENLSISFQTIVYYGEPYKTECNDLGFRHYYTQSNYPECYRMIKSYEDLGLMIEQTFDYFNMRGVNENTSFSNKTIDETYRYLYNQYSSIISEYNRFKTETNHSIAWVNTSTAAFDGEVTLTCNKTLFGLAPGSDLSTYFNILPIAHCRVADLENPRLYEEFGSLKKLSMREYFVKNTLLQSHYILRFNTIPKEKYDEIEFTLTIPLRVLGLKDYIQNKVNGVDSEMKTVQTGYVKKCPVKIYWE